MKKIILFVILLLGILGFAKKYQPNKKTLDVFMEENFGDSMYGSVWNNDIRNKNGDEDAPFFESPFDFIIFKNEADGNMYLHQIYDEDGKSGGRDVYYEVVDGIVKVGEYRIFPHSVKGVYYVKDFVDIKGKTYDKLYFGFDEVNTAIVILDKNLNVLQSLTWSVAN